MKREEDLEDPRKFDALGIFSKEAQQKIIEKHEKLQERLWQIAHKRHKAELEKNNYKFARDIDVIKKEVDQDYLDEKIFDKPIKINEACYNPLNKHN